MELATNLEGMARGVLSDVKPEHRPNFAVLVDKLMQKFKPDGQVTIYQLQQQNHKHRRNKTIPELVHEINRIARKAYPMADEVTRSSMAVSSFISSLGNEAKQHFVNQKDPQNLEDATRAALSYETSQPSVSKDAPLVWTQKVLTQSDELPSGHGTGWWKWRNRLKNTLGSQVEETSRQIAGIINLVVGDTSCASIVDRKDTLCEGVPIGVVNHWGSR